MKLFDELDIKAEKNQAKLFEKNLAVAAKKDSCQLSLFICSYVVVCSLSGSLWLRQPTKDLRFDLGIILCLHMVLMDHTKSIFKIIV